MPNLVELAQLFFDLWCPQTDRRHAKNEFFGVSMPQTVEIHQNLEIDFLDQCNTFSIEKVKMFYTKVVRNLVQNMIKDNSDL